MKNYRNGTYKYVFNKIGKMLQSYWNICMYM